MAVVGILVGLLTSMLIMGGASAEAPAAGARLGVSNFEGIDGNLAVDATGDPARYDWDSQTNEAVAVTVGAVSFRATRNDAPTGGQDDSFGGGMKEDSASLLFTEGSIPNNKSDLLTFRLADENRAVPNTPIYLHLAWTRANTLGTANMDFEFNQNKCEIDATTGLPTVGSSCASISPPMPTRASGDMLITYDFSNGGKTADKVGLGMYRWNGSRWSNFVALSDTAHASAWINATEILNADNSVRYAPLTFGEVTLNLTSLLENPASPCTRFGSAYLKSRSSDSFTSQLKDFIAPMTTSITNCRTPVPGNITVAKQDDSGAPLAGFTFELYNNAVVSGVDTVGTKTSKPDCTTDALGTCSFTGLAAGTYWVKEPAVSGWGTPTDAATPTVNTLTDRVQKVVVQDLDTVHNPIVTFRNPRLFKVIVLVCQEHTTGAATPVPAMRARSVTFNGGGGGNSATSPPTGASVADTCGLGGAVATGLTATQVANLDVQAPTP